MGDLHSCVPAAAAVAAAAAAIATVWYSGHKMSNSFNRPLTQSVSQSVQLHVKTERMLFKSGWIMKSDASLRILVLQCTTFVQQNSISCVSFPLLAIARYDELINSSMS